MNFRNNQIGGIIADAVTTLGGSIVSTVIDALGEFLTGVGGNIVEVFNKIVVDPTTGGLTNFAVWSLVFLGVGLATGVIGSIIRKVG